ncbi:hypothetical protein [Blastococcus sp. SYSU D00813]
MNGPLKAAWALTAFVVLAGAVLWIVSGKAVFAVFIVLGLLTGAGAWVTGRSLPKGDTTP